jgi:hypothetical protein
MTILASRPLMHLHLWPSEVFMGPEPFVSADEAARFLAINCRYVLALARKGIAGAYGLGTGIKTKNLSVPVLGTRGCGCGQKQRSKNAEMRDPASGSPR